MTTAHTIRVLTWTAFVALSVVACANKRPVPAPTPVTEPQPQPPVAAREPTRPAPAPVARPPTELERETAQTYALQGAELLQDGSVTEARIELQRSRKLDPQNSLATDLLQQIDEDPAAWQGKDYFERTVASGDTLSRIAERYLGNKFRFYFLARYNNISVPRHLQVGQVIKIPGKAPKEDAVKLSPKPAPPRAPPPQDIEAPAGKAFDLAVEMYGAADHFRNAGNVKQMRDYLDKSHYYYREGLRLTHNIQAHQPKPSYLKQHLADSYHREAMKTYTRREVDLAIPMFQRVLEIDPEHQLASDYLKRAADLQRRIDNLRTAK